MWPMCRRQPEGEPPAFARKTRAGCPSKSRCSRASRSWCRSSGPIGTKGARLSTQISIAGRLLVFCRRTTTWACRRRFPWPSVMRCARLQALVGDKSTGGGGGFICAPMAKIRPTPSWPKTLPTCARPGRASRRRRALPAGSLLHQDLDLLQRVLRDLVSDHTQTIRIDSMEQFHRCVPLGRSSCRRLRSQAAALQRRAPDFDL